MEKNTVLNTIKTSIKLTLPVMAGYEFLGIAFGLLMRANGFPVWLPIIMSIAIFSGALEFAAVPILSAPFDPASSFILGFMLSIRHMFYGIPMLKKYAGTKAIKPFLIFGLTDETFSILSTTDAPPKTDPKLFYFLVTLFDFSYWVSGSALGAIFGNFITFDITGIDFALTALFIVLFLEQIKTKVGMKSGFIGLISSAAVLSLFGSEYFVLISMVIIMALLILGKKVIQNE